MRRKLGLIRVEGRSGSRMDGGGEKWGLWMNGLATRGAAAQSPSSVHRASQNAAYIIKAISKGRGFAIVLCSEASGRLFGGAVLGRDGKSKTCQ